LLHGCNEHPPSAPKRDAAGEGGETRAGLFPAAVVGEQNRYIKRIAVPQSLRTGSSDNISFSLVDGDFPKECGGNGIKHGYGDRALS
jgi:hypothetical protein